VVVVFAHCPQVLNTSAYNAIWYVNQLSRVGYIALDIFFMISGFFISRLLPSSAQGSKRHPGAGSPGLRAQHFSPRRIAPDGPTSLRSRRRSDRGVAVSEIM
jgi:peptidoglycan/LPS O-acetylase OafA/YrhL